MKCEIDFIPTKRRDRTLKNGMHYPDPKNRAEAEAIRAAYTGGYHEGPVEVVIDTYAKLPKGKKNPEPNTHKPDADNTAKAILDSLNGIAFEDDRFVVFQSCRKHPRTAREKPKTVFEVIPCE